MKLTRYFIKSNSSSVLIPPLCTVSDNNDHILHSTDKEKADCLNDYFTLENVNLYVFEDQMTKPSQVDQLSPSQYSVRNNIKVQSKATSLVYASMMYYKIAIGSLKKSQVAIGNLKNKEKNKQKKTNVSQNCAMERQLYLV